MGRDRSKPKKNYGDTPPSGDRRPGEFQVKEATLDNFLSRCPGAVNDERIVDKVTRLLADDDELESFYVKVTDGVAGALESYSVARENEVAVVRAEEMQTYKETRKKKLRAMYDEWLSKKGTDFGKDTATYTEAGTNAQHAIYKGTLSMLNIDSYLSCTSSKDETARSIVTRFFQGRGKDCDIACSKRQIKMLKRTDDSRNDDLEDMDKSQRSAWVKSHQDKVSTMAKKWFKEWQDTQPTPQATEKEASASSTSSASSAAGAEAEAELSMYNIDTYLSSASYDDTEARSIVNQFFAGKGAPTTIKTSKMHAETLGAVKRVRKSVLEDMDESHKRSWMKEHQQSISKTASNWLNRSQGASDSSGSGPASLPSVPASSQSAAYASPVSRGSNWTANSKPIEWSSSPSGALVPAAA